jgi:hypothetical protein
MSCEHNYVLGTTSSYKRRINRFTVEWVKIDHYYCSKCLDEQEKKKRYEGDPDSDSWEIPAWALSITTTAPSADYA